MALTKLAIDPETLRRHWQARCEQGNFSSAVLGLGTVHVFGRTGKPPIHFPRIASLSIMHTLYPDEQWAIRIVRNLILAARVSQRPVLAPTTLHPLETEDVSQAIEEFDPQLETIFILDLVSER